ncbi:MAG: molecular chaperone TorD family protein [Caldilineae bacterium]|nr:molecular chaperone TorD family protein [Caldilineae bacterium]
MTDLPALRAMPGFPDALALQARGDDAALVEALAVEYQRLLGFNLPPYESLFVDPSAMLQAPSTGRVRTLYREAGWQIPSDVRAAADDHLGAELLALAELFASGRPALAQRLVDQHLARWLPVFIEAYERLDPAPFYRTLGALTLGTVMGMLPEAPCPAPRAELDSDPGRAAQSPRAAGSSDPAASPEVQALLDAAWQDAARMPGRAPRAARAVEAVDPASTPLDPDGGLGLRELVRQLCAPQSAGFFLSRHDLAVMARAADLPGAAGDRSHMFESLLRSAGAYGMVEPVVAGLLARIDEADASYAAMQETWAAWSATGGLWRARLVASRALLAEALDRSERPTGPMPI